MSFGSDYVTDPFEFNRFCLFMASSHAFDNKHRSRKGCLQNNDAHKLFQKESRFQMGIKFHNMILLIEASRANQPKRQQNNALRFSARKERHGL